MEYYPVKLIFCKPGSPWHYDSIIVCKLLCLDKSLKEMITFFHQLNSLNLSFESIEDNLVIDRNQWDIAFSAIHFYQNLKAIKFEFEDE